jgi:hypothetical protein
VTAPELDAQLRALVRDWRARSWDGGFHFARCADELERTVWGEPEPARGELGERERKRASLPMLARRHRPANLYSTDLEVIVAVDF